MPKKKQAEEFEDAFTNLDSAIDKIEVKKDEMDEPPVGWLPTSSTLLNLLLSGRPDGGFPMGKITRISGDSSTGKSFIAQDVLKNVIEVDGTAIYAESEGRFNEEFARDVIGVNLDSLLHIPCHTIEQLFTEIIPKAAKLEDKPVVVVADSITSMYSEERKEDQLARGYAPEPLLISQALPRVAKLCNMADITVILVGQNRAKMGAMPFQKQTQATGGKAIGFYCSVELETSLITKVHTTRIGNKIVIGIASRVHCAKSSVSVPFITVPVRILFRHGIDDIASCLMWIRQVKTKEDKGAYTLLGESLGTNLPKAIAAVEETPKAVQMLRDEVEEMWHTLYDKREWRYE